MIIFFLFESSSINALLLCELLRVIRGQKTKTNQQQQQNTSLLENPRQSQMFTTMNELHWYVLRLHYDSHFIAGNDRRCSDLLRRLLRNPPNNTKVAINIGLSKARYLCREGFKLVGMEIRTCKGGKWKENIEPKCLSKLR